MKRKNYLSSTPLILIGIFTGALFFSNLAPISQAEESAPSINNEINNQEGEKNPVDQPLLTLRDFNKAYINIAKKVNPAVVTVFTEKIHKVRNVGSPFFNSPFDPFFKDFFGRQFQPKTPQEKEYRQQGLGSGVIVDNNGYILTNNHVIEGADTIYVRLMDLREIPVKVIGADPKTDIAVLKVDEENLTYTKLGDSNKLEVGEWVLAIGSPMSPDLAHTVTNGIVSAKGRSNVGLADYEDFIQTDAAINPGNSGGALINLDGELVGINTAIATRSGGYQGIGFAVPINMAKNVMKSLIKHGTVVRGWLGIYIQDVNETMATAMDLPNSKGTLVSDVSEDGPAEEAGIKPGDVILKLNETLIDNTAQLRNLIAAMTPETDVVLLILRDGEEKKVKVSLGKLAADEIAPEIEERLNKLFGFKAVPFDEQASQKYGHNKSLKGVIVTELRKSSQPFRSGLRNGDLIVAFNRNKLDGIEDFNEAISNIKEGNTVLFTIIRNNRSFFVAFKL
ncbi:MAG: Do family serine endopeptidase [Calditrichaeota bacterium]|nr:Do family serine endopeptidase [Calditrichota bacterium]